MGDRQALGYLAKGLLAVLEQDERNTMMAQAMMGARRRLFGLQDQERQLARLQLKLPRACQLPQAQRQKLPSQMTLEPQCRKVCTRKQRQLLLLVLESPGEGLRAKASSVASDDVASSKASAASHRPRSPSRPPPARPRSPARPPSRSLPKPLPAIRVNRYRESHSLGSDGGSMESGRSAGSVLVQFIFFTVCVLRVTASKSRSRKKTHRGTKGKKRKEWYAERHPEGVRPKPPRRDDNDDDFNGPGD
eukprot:s2217_g12.t1